MTRVYIAGPITGMPGHNEAAFNEAAVRLCAAGYEPANPHAITPYVEGKPWHEYLREDIAVMVTCDGVALLDGWETSAGADVERSLALRLAMPVKTLREWLTTFADSGQ